MGIKKGRKLFSLKTFLKIGSISRKKTVRVLQCHNNLDNHALDGKFQFSLHCLFCIVAHKKRIKIVNRTLNPVILLIKLPN